MEDGDDVVEALRTGKEFNHKSLEPKLKASEIEVDPDKPETETKKAHEEKQFELEFQEDRKIFVERLERYRKNKATVAATTWKLCTEKMKLKLQSRKDFVTIKRNSIELLKAIKQHALSYETTQCRMKTVLEAATKAAMKALVMLFVSPSNARLVLQRLGLK